MAIHAMAAATVVAVPVAAMAVVAVSVATHNPNDPRGEPVVRAVVLAKVAIVRKPHGTPEHLRHHRIYPRERQRDRAKERVDDISPMRMQRQVQEHKLTRSPSPELPHPEFIKSMWYYISTCTASSVALFVRFRAKQHRPA